MKILKSIYENEVEVKEISVLKSLFIIIMFTLIIRDNKFFINIYYDSYR